MHTKYENITEEILELAGVKINGSNPWDIRIHNDEFYICFSCCIISQRRL